MSQSLQTDPEPILCIIGPTAVGKTRVAIDICRQWGAEIVGADASQIYRGLDIGTGKARPDELDGVRHHLIDVVEPDEPFDAATFVRHADSAIAHARQAGARIIVCGGTGLYLRALVHGLCSAPTVTEEIRQAISARIDRGELPQLHEELRAVDPDAAARIAPRDRQRIQRALGVYRTTGETLSAWQQRHRFTNARYDVRYLGLRMPRDELARRIQARVDQMFASGFTQEVSDLLARGHRPDLRSMGALGYRQIALALEGKMTLDEARKRTIIATRQYAKRQMTWFRALDRVEWLRSPIDLDDARPFIERVWGDPVLMHPPRGPIDPSKHRLSPEKTTTQEIPRPMLVAIDGPAGAGKSTVAQKVADRLGFSRIDTGALYRGVALAALRAEIPPESDAGLRDLMSRIDLRFSGAALYLDGHDVSTEIRQPELSAAASRYAAIVTVRDGLLELQRRLGRSGNSVLEGRDIGTVVFPDAEVKIYLTASAEVRAQRRTDELQASGVDVLYETVLADIQTRDNTDTHRAVAALRRAENAQLVDTTHLDIDGAVEACLGFVRAHIERHRPEMTGPRKERPA